MIILGLDFETTGLDFVESRIIEVGAIFSGQHAVVEREYAPATARVVGCRAARVQGECRCAAARVDRDRLTERDLRHNRRTDRVGPIGIARRHVADGRRDRVQHIRL